MSVKETFFATCAVLALSASGAKAAGESELSGGRAEALMDGLFQGGVPSVLEGGLNERWCFDEVFCTVGYTAVVCRLRTEGAEERYVQGAPAEAMARALVGPQGSLYNISVTGLECRRGPQLKPWCGFKD